MSRPKGAAPTESTLAEIVSRMLIGEPMVTSARAADMEMFGFGDQFWRDDFAGPARFVSRHALHVQCHWRIVGDDQVVVGYRDLREPCSDHPDPSNFDGEIGSTQRDELLAQFHASGREHPRLATTCEIGPAGWLRVALDDGSALEVFPDTSAGADDEYWRLFDTTTDVHYVVSGHGVDRSAARRRSRPPRA